MKLPLLTILFLSMTSFLTAQNPCQDNLADLQLIGTHNGHNYYLSDYLMKPADAQLNAATYGGYLAVINDEAENNFLQQNISEMVYIGLNDVDSEGTLAWNNTAAVNYTNFDICNFCNENSDEMDYVMMHPWNGGWSWSNQWNARKYIVEIPCGGSTDISLTMTTSNVSVVEGKEFVVTLIVENLGAADATGIWIKYYDYPSIDQSADEIDETISHGTISDFWYNGKDWFIPALQSGEKAELKITYEVKVGVTESFSANAFLNELDQVDENASNDTSEVEVRVNESTDVSINMTTSKNSVLEGEQFVVTLTVENLGTTPATEIWIKYYDYPVIDQSVIEINEIISHGSIIDFWYNGKDWFITELQSGEVAQLTLTYEAKTGVTEDFTAFALLVELDQFDTNSSNDNSGVGVFINTSNCGNDIDGFITLGEYGNSIFYLSESNATNALTAQITCESYGGNLASINSQAENDLIFQGISEMTYIGLNDRQNEGTLEWYDGNPVDFTNFNFCSFCNENSYDFNNVVMHQWDGTWSWSNTSNPRKFVMEVPCSSTTGADLALTINASATEVGVGDPFDVTLSVTNNGPEGATNISMIVWRSEYAEIVTGTPSAGTFEYDYYLNYSWEIPALAVGETAELILNCEATASPFSTTYSLGGGVEELDQIDPNPTNDNVSVGLTKIQMGGCPNAISGFTLLGEFGNSKYFLSNDIARPAEAQAIAESHGGWLATPTNQAENDFIQQNISKVAYIGLTDVDIEETYTWMSGEPVSFINFDICTFCNANEEIMDYVMIHPWNGGWSWSNEWNARKYIVEIPCGNNSLDEIPNTLISMTNSSDDQMEMKRIFPNPTKDVMYVAIKGNEKKTIQLQVINTYGQLVQNTQALLYKGENTIEVNTSALTGGMYFIRIPEWKGQVENWKFLKIQD